MLWKEKINLDIFENIISVIEFALSTERKRHITGGILLSVSMLFGGLAFTVITAKMKENDNE